MVYFPRETARVFRVACVVQAVMGLTMGLYLYTFGPLFYENLAALADPKLAITLTTTLFVIDSLLGAMLEVPTGAIGDAIGRKKTVLWSLFFRTFYFIFLAFIPFSKSLPLTLFLGIIALFAFRIGYTFFSGSFTAWCVDKLREVHPTVGCDQILARGYTYNFVALTLGGVLGVLCYLHQIPHYGFLAAAVASAACMVFCMGEMENEKSMVFLSGTQLTGSAVAKRAGEILGVGFQVFRESRVILALVWIYAAYMCAVNVVDYLWPVYLRSNVAPALQPRYWIGLVLVTMGLCALASKVVHAFSVAIAASEHPEMAEKWQKILFLASCLVTALPLLWLSRLTAMHLDSFGGLVVALVPVQFSYGIMAPCFETLVNNNIPAKYAPERATILSFGSLVRSLMLVFLAVPSGGSSGATTSTGWAIPAGILLLATVYGCYALFRSEQSESSVSERTGFVPSSAP